MLAAFYFAIPVGRLDAFLLYDYYLKHYSRKQDNRQRKIATKENDSSVHEYISSLSSMFTLALFLQKDRLLQLTSTPRKKFNFGS